MSRLGTRPLQDNLGTEVLNIDLSELDDVTFEWIRQEWQRDPVLLFRRQSLSEEDLLVFSKRFGFLDLDTIKDINTDDPATEDRNPELFFVSNLHFEDGSKVGGLSNDEIVWHTDLIYRENPASGTIFYGVEMPKDTAKTSFCNMAHAYRTLPNELRQAVDGKRARCKYGTEAPLSSFMRRNVDKNFRRETASVEETEAIDRRTPEVVHDMVLENAATGERSLYLSPNHTTAIENLSKKDGRELFDALMEHALRPENIYNHDWRNGDVLLWDNTRLLHKRGAFSGRIPRLAKRTTVYMDATYFPVPKPAMKNATT
jgi:taurine dioxygenase